MRAESLGCYREGGRSESAMRTSVVLTKQPCQRAVRARRIRGGHGPLPGGRTTLYTFRGEFGAATTQERRVCVCSVRR